MDAAVVGRVVDGQARRATLGGAAAAGGICGWWAPLVADSAHMGFTVHVCSGVSEGCRFDAAWWSEPLPPIGDDTGRLRHVTECADYQGRYPETLVHVRPSGDSAEPGAVRPSV